MIFNIYTNLYAFFEIIIKLLFVQVLMYILKEMFLF